MEKKFIYIGVRVGSQNKKSFRYVELLENGHSEEVSSFKSKLVGIENVGTVISSNVEGTTFKGSKIADEQIDERHPSYQYISEWSIQSRAEQLKYERVNEAKRQHPKSVEVLVAELKRNMGFMDRKDRASFALWVYNQLT